MNKDLARPFSKSSRRHWLVQSAAAACALSFSSKRVSAASDIGIQTAEAIHQEVAFNAKPGRIYGILTDASLFQKVELLSAAMDSLDVISHPAVVGCEPGTAFSLFGNYIVGRQIELVPDRRIVQAWRVESWTAGIYSIARFELAADGPKTKLVFDHTGFPSGMAEHLASGWYANYWDPLSKFIG